MANDAHGAGGTGRRLGRGRSPATNQPTDPMRFFEGRTESISTVKVITKKPYRSRTIGDGQISADGVLNLVQRVHEEGREPYSRRWRMRRVVRDFSAGR